MRWCITNVTCKNLAVVLYNRYMVNAQNFIQILYLVLYAGIYRSLAFVNLHNLLDHLPILISSYFKTIEKHKSKSE